MNSLRQKIKELQQDNEIQCFILNLSELEQRKVMMTELWGWPRPRWTILDEKEVRIEDPDPKNHRRKIRLRSNGEWQEERKRRLDPGENSVTNIVRVSREVKWTYNLSSNLQNLVSQCLLQPRNPTNLAELQNRIQAVHFVRGNGYNTNKPWLIFNKQWLYEQINNSIDEEFFIVQGTCSNFQTKNDTELKVFLQQQRLLPTNTTQQPNLNPIQANTSQNLNSNPYPTPPPSPNFTAVSISNNSVSESNNSSSRITTPNQPANSYSENSPVNNSTLNNPSSNFSSSNNNQTSPKLNSPTPVSDITISQPTSLEKSNNNNSDLLTTNPKSNHDFNSEPSLSENNNNDNNEINLNYLNNPPSKSDKPNSPNENNLTTQKQQIIQQIKTELDQSPNLDLGKFSNWKQNIEKISDIQQLQTYQSSLQQYLQSKKSSLTNSTNQSQLNSSKSETSHSKFIGLIVGGLLGIIIIVLIFWVWKRGKKIT